jgi:hypothetical protein
VSALVNVTGVWKEKAVVLMPDPDVFVLGLGVVQLARDVLALLRERSIPPEIRIVIIRREAK